MGMGKWVATRKRCKKAIFIIWNQVHIYTSHEQNVTGMDTAQSIAAGSDDFSGPSLAWNYCVG